VTSADAAEITEASLALISLVRSSAAISNNFFSQIVSNSNSNGNSGNSSLGVSDGEIFVDNGKFLNCLHLNQQQGQEQRQEHLQEQGQTVRCVSPTYGYSLQPRK